MSKNTSTISKIDLKIMQTNKRTDFQADAPVGIFDS